MEKKRIVSLILAIMIIMGILPLGEVAYAQDEIVVNRIEIFRTYKDISDKGTYSIAIHGSGLSRTQVLYMPTGGGEYKLLGTPGPGSSDYFLQFKIDPEEQISSLQIAGKSYIIDETGMPKINKIHPPILDITEDNPQIKLEGENLDISGNGEIQIFANTQDVSDKFINPTEVILDSSTLNKLDKGMNNIIIKRVKMGGGGDPTIETIYNQNNLFRIYEGLHIEKEDITIYPNRGKVGTETTITIRGNTEKFSVFFLEDETKPFLYENMGQDPYYSQTPDNQNGIIRVKVPQGLGTGQTYKVVITNNLDTVKKPNMDLTNYITKQKVIGEFYVVDASVCPTIEKVVPNEGTSDGSYVTIYGYRLEELNITDLEGQIHPVSSEDLNIESGGINDPTKLVIDYNIENVDDNNKVKYNGKDVTFITRSFLVTIGRDAIFEKEQEEYKEKNIFNFGEDQVDQLYVKTRTIDGEDLRDPIKDVVIEITTTITADGQNYVFTEIARLPKGYTFLPSHQEPIIERVVPDKIQVDREINPETKNDTILSIQGKDFNVFRYEENGEFKTNYPKIVLGGSGEGTGQIIIEKDGDGKVVYFTREEGGSLKKTTIENPLFEVLDKNGNIVTGIGGNEVGDSIVIKIPKGLMVSSNILNRPLPVAVANPKRDSKERGIYSFKNDAISFVTVLSEPIIERVDPYIVTIEGGEDIIVEGRNFQDGIKVFIDGKEIQNVIRDIDRLTTRGTLKFKAPKGREGENILQVMNPDGGTHTHEFIYVQTMKIDPKITSIAPNKGTKDTLVVIKGDNFLKPDQTTVAPTGLGFYKLIGTRVFLGIDDVNTYNSTGLEPYSSPEITKERLLKKEKDPWTNEEQLILSPYYRNSTTKDEEGNFYSIYVDYEGRPVISGEENTYTFQLMGEYIKAIDQNGHYYDVESEENSLKIIDGEDTALELSISFDYSIFSIGQNEFGGKYLRVADYYDSLILRSNGNHYIIEVDDMDRVTLSDGKNDIYEIILDKDQNKILATKGNQKYTVAIEKDSITLNNITFEFITPYSIDPTTQIITGHRAKVKNRNEIWVIIPKKSIPGFYDVTVRNPDTKSHSIKNGFEYLIPQSKPTINYITPSQGSVEGGYEIVIYGEGFEDSSEVYISGVKVPIGDTKVNKQDYKSITIKVPKYPGDIDMDFITDKKFVPLVVLNEDGGSAHREDLFAYVIASSRPRIDRINPVKASAAGGDIIEIWGYDFRYYEPYKGEIPKEGDTNYEDIDRDGKWTNMKSDKDCKKISIDHPLYDEYCASPVLPKVFFGNEEAKIVEFREGYIKVIAPRFSQLGTVDVYILNNDAGTSNKVKFTFEGSNPIINSIIPQTGKKQGGERVDIIGSNFKPNNIRLFNLNGEEINKTTYLVRFGEISNKHIPREGENSGRIDSGRATVNLAGGLKVEYKLESGIPTIKLTLQEGNKKYEGEYPYSSGEKYIDLKSTKDSDDNYYPGFELLKVQITDGRLLVDRGYAPETKETFKDHLEVLTPSYYSVGNVNVAIENPDGISNKIGFEYKNPDSKPEITNITRDGNEPIPGDDGRIKVVPVHYQGGSIISVEGKDIRENATIQIGNILTINPKDIEYTLPYKMTFTMPAVTETALGRLHKVVVINEDGGTASSDSISPPIYIQFIKGESNPSIESITPDRGPTKGGTKIIIKGNDFRETMEGYDGKRLKVYFGEHPVEDKDITVIDYKTLEVITPPGTPGRVEVKVENPDGTLSRPSGYFTYISGPIINRVEDSITGSRISNISVKGGQEIRLKGYEFLPGARVVFAPKIRKAEPGETGQLIYIEGVAYILEEGLNGSNFNFIDQETVLITTPQGELGDKGIIIINPDGGASPIYDITYDLPDIEAPEEVIAEIVFDRYIKVHWQPVPGASYYEIYEIDRRGRDEFLDSTELTSFLYKDIEPRTNYRFLVKAVGEFGSSPPSMLSNRVRTGRYAGYEDKDGNLGEYTTINKTGQTVNISLGYRDYHRTMLRLTDMEYKGTKEVIVSIPLDLVYESSYNNQLSIIGEDFTLNFSPMVFRNNTYNLYRKDGDAGIRFKISYHTGNTNLNGKTSLSNQLLLEGEFYRGKNVEKIENLMSSMDLTLKYDSVKANLRNISQQDIYYFDPNESKWVQIPNTTNYSIYNEIYTNINKLGRYTILGSRR